MLFGLAPFLTHRHFELLFAELSRWYQHMQHQKNGSTLMLDYDTGAKKRHQYYRHRNQSVAEDAVEFKNWRGTLF